MSQPQVPQQVSAQAPPPPPAPTEDLNPYLIDPIVLGLLHRLAERSAKEKPEAEHEPRISFAALAAIVFAVVVGGVVGCAAIEGRLLRPAGSGPFWRDVSHFLLRDSTVPSDTNVPYLRDYPSMVLTIAVAAAICLVYVLFRDAGIVHSELDRKGCIKETGRPVLQAEIAQLNRRFRRLGRYWSTVAFLASIGFILVSNIGVAPRLFPFLGPDVYDTWWARIRPVSPGGVAWVVFGGIGVYMVYVEAVLGLNYVWLLRRINRAKVSVFQADMVNPDGWYGWHRLRRVITNLQFGIFFTVLSAGSFSFFLPAVGPLATVGIIAFFVGVTLYVYFGVNLNFRAQFRRDVLGQREVAQGEIGKAGPEADATAQLRALVAFQRLQLIDKIPISPVRQTWVSRWLSIVSTVLAIIIPLVQYFVPF
jgi:hypothetical protein